MCARHLTLRKMKRHRVKIRLKKTQIPPYKKRNHPPCHTTMFGIGTASVILALTFMGPTVSFIIIAMYIAYVAGIFLTVFKDTMSDKTLAEDLANIKYAFDTETIIKSSPTQQDVISYYTTSGDREHRLLEMFTGPGMHTCLSAKDPINSSSGKARQVMYVMNAAVEAHTMTTEVTRVLEIGTGRGYCTFLMASLLPTTDYEFHGIDIVKRNIEVARKTAADYTNVHFHLSDATITKSYRPYGSTKQFDLIFAVESLCHLDTEYAIRAFFTNAFNHLTPEGKIIIIDGFRSENFTNAPNNQQLAMHLAEHSLSIKRMRSMSEFIESAYSQGLQLKRLEDLTTQALPHWLFGWRFAHAILRHAPSWVIRRLRAHSLTAHSTDSLLALATVAHAMRDRGAMVYGVMVFEKK